MSSDPRGIRTARPRQGRVTFALITRRGWQ